MPTAASPLRRGLAPRAMCWRLAAHRQPSVPRAAKTPTEHTAPPGLLLESRVARLWFWNGYFARYGIDLKRIYDPEPLQITDLDLLAYQLGPDLASRRMIGETKGGTGKSAPRPLDRVVWLAGLVRAHRPFRVVLRSGLRPSACWGASYSHSSSHNRS